MPESLYIFLLILLGGTDALDQQPGEFNNQITSIAQDIIFLVSKRRKLTSKHICIGLTLHHATRSEKLVDLLHAAGHTVGMDTIRRIDSTRATDILVRYEENGFVYIPYELETYSPGRIVLASCDNIDVLEETADAKNTVHSTQTMLWQRGPAIKRRNVEMKIGRAKTVPRDSVEKFHKLDYAYQPAGERRKPVFHPSLEINIKTWFTESENQVDARLKNFAWRLVRMYMFLLKIINNSREFYSIRLSCSVT